jgi:bifunctional enzyme CysN/CysC
MRGDRSSYLAVPAAGGSLLRFITCGSVDDGKSTLIGRLLFEAGVVFDDQIEGLRKLSRRSGATEDIDFALLVDGLEAERQQGITIDVAHLYFATQRRSFVIADTPGHEQYTRNMATGASNADLAIVLVDASKGSLVQTRRHSLIVSLMGIRHVVLAVSKIDLVGYDEERFNTIVSDYSAFAAELGFHTMVAIPVSAKFADNIVAASANTPWYTGPTLMAHLEAIDVEAEAAPCQLRFPVQWVNRPSGDFRGLAGTVASGRVAPGDRVVIAASGKEARVASVLSPDGEPMQARAGDAVTITLMEQLDVSRGDVLAAPEAAPVVADQFAAHLLWFDEEPLFPGRSYIMRAGNIWTQATVTSIRHLIDPESGEKRTARSLSMNEIGFCNLSAARAIPLDPYPKSREMGSFILVDRFTNHTAGAGMVAFALRRATNIHRENFLVEKAARASRLGQKPLVLWFTGLSGSGKSTIARLVERELHREGRLTYSLDGDNLRHGLCRDLGFTAADRVENIRRAGEVARLMVDAGLIVLCSFISPFRAERRMVREMLQEGEFIEIFVDAPLEECIRRDPKGLYAKSLHGALPNFTGIDSPYEAPDHSDLHLDTLASSPEDCVRVVLARLRQDTNT